MYRFLVWTLMALLFTGSALAQTDETNMRAKFLPPDGKTLLIVGQDLGAVGGLEGYADGYSDSIDVIPGGLTTYTDIATLNGLTNVGNWGSGDVSAQLLMDAPRYRNSTLAIGLWLSGGNEVRAASGALDGQIDRLGAWIKAQNRPVYLRIGYEFDGEWNAYDPENYIAAFRRIMDRLRAAGVDNVATVWQSATHHTPHYGGHEWTAWYPGDEYVDWFGLSYFQPYPNILNGFLDLARAHGKPVMIAESAPKGFSTATADADELWASWYQPFFDFIHANDDVIRAVAYINVDWESQPMWANHEDHWGDSRVQANDGIRARWLDEISGESWLHGSHDLFWQLGYSTDAQVVAPGDEWKLVWSDEFDGDALDRDKWNTTLGDMPGAAGQRYHNTSYAQYLMDDDTIVENGLLRLRAQKRTVVGDEPPGTYDYTAGWVSTADKFDFTYGYVEIRARYPAGVGMWPAFWMLASDNVWGPEFDVAEYFGNQQRMHFGLMYTEYPSVNWDSQNYRTPSWETDWHTYALEWNPGEAHFIVDGQIVHTILADYVPSEPMYLILQNGVGTATGPAGAPNSETVFPNFLDVDYIRVYQRIAQARIVNRGFETGTTAGWDVSPGVDVLRRDAYSGRFAVRLRGDGSYAQQTIRGLVPLTTYILTMRGKVTDVGDLLYGGTHSNGSTTRLAMIVRERYGQAYMTFNTGFSFTSQVTVYCEKTAGEGEAFCDDFQLRVITDPSALFGFPA
jgi:beta-glucanase (GH16 family)